MMLSRIPAYSIPGTTPELTFLSALGPAFRDCENAFARRAGDHFLHSLPKIVFHPRWSWSEQEQLLWGVVYFTREAEGPPAMAHGGAQAASHDNAQSVANTLAFGHPNAATGTLSLNYRAPVPLEQTLLLRVQLLEGSSRRKRTLRSELRSAGGAVFSSAEAVWVLPRALADVPAVPFETLLSRLPPHHPVPPSLWEFPAVELPARLLVPELDEAMRRAGGFVPWQPPHFMLSDAGRPKLGFAGRHFDLFNQMNAKKMRARLWRRGSDGELIAAVHFSRFCQGKPGAVHGGALATAFDECVGLAVAATKGGCATVRLEVKYRASVPLPPAPAACVVLIRARVVSEQGRKIRAEATMVQFGGGDLSADAPVLATADALFVQFRAAVRDEHGMHAASKI